MHILARRKQKVKEEVPIVKPVPWEGHEQALYYCSTTRQLFKPICFDYFIASGRVFAWAFCPLCDSHCRGRGQAGYNKNEPQPHLYVLDNVSPDTLAALTARLNERRGMVCREDEHAL